VIGLATVPLCKLHNQKMSLHLFAITAIALCVSAQSIPPNTPLTGAAKRGSNIGKLNSQQKAKNPEQNQSSSQPISACSECVNCCPIQQQPSETEDEQAKKKSLDALYRGYLWATIIGVGGAIFGLLVLICQTVLLRRSANAARDAAEVAKANTNALINIERAWLVLDGFDPKGKDFWEISHKNVYFGNSERIPITVRFKNYGHTPAWLIESAFNLEVSKATDSEFSFEYKEFQKSEGEPIAPNTDAAPINVEINPRGYLTLGEMIDIGDKKLFLYFYGFVKYKDVFSEQTKETRETSFCYRLHCKPNERSSGSWVYCGPKGANKNT
jgi:hypothetical protein